MRVPASFEDDEPPDVLPYPRAVVGTDGLLDFPEDGPLTVCGLWLNDHDATVFRVAVVLGAMVINPSVPVSSRAPEAWRRWCSEKGRECSIVDVRVNGAAEVRT
jgi:hypothetical protein